MKKKRLTEEQIAYASAKRPSVCWVPLSPVKAPRLASGSGNAPLVHPTGPRWPPSISPSSASIATTICSSSSRVTTPFVASSRISAVR